MVIIIIFFSSHIRGKIGRNVRKCRQHVRERIASFYGDRDGGVALLVECQASNRKVAKRWLDSRCGSTSLCLWERYLMLFFILGSSSLLVVVPQPDERHASRTIICVGVIWQTQSIVKYLVQTKKTVTVWSGSHLFVSSLHHHCIVACLDKAPYDSYLCLVVSNKQQIIWKDVKNLPKNLEIYKFLANEDSSKF